MSTVLLGEEDLGCFGHEGNPAKDDHLGIRASGLDAQTQGIAHIIGDILDLGQLIVMRQDDGAALSLETINLLNNIHTILQAALPSFCGNHRWRI